MNYYLIAGERSGDMHGANLIDSLKKIDSKAQFQGFGGDSMQNSGMKLSQHYKEIAFMGFLDVLKNVFFLRKIIKNCQNDIQSFQPDALILIDYAGFNLRIARWVHEKLPHIPIFYFIAPKAWAWNKSRVNVLKKIVKKLFVILPFEEPFFQKEGIRTVYVGNPLVEKVEEFLKNEITEEVQGSKKSIALLPGSRVQEIQKLLPLMCEISLLYPDYQWFVAKVSNISEKIYQPFQEKYPHLYWVLDKTYEIISRADVCLVTSGTATLEVALFQKPQIIGYVTHELNYQVGRRLLTIPFISLPNLIANKRVAMELIQHDWTIENLKKELDLLLNKESERYQEMRNGYNELKHLLTKEKIATQTVAEEIIDFLT